MLADMHLQSVLESRWSWACALASVYVLGSV